jgi:hypothetical protein
MTSEPVGAAVGICWECGYPLKGLPTPRCPECGRPFDPADPATMNLGRHVGGVAGRLLRPPGWPLYTLTAVAVLVSVWATASPMPSGQIGPMLTRVWEQLTSPGWGRVLGAYNAVEVQYGYAVLAWLIVAAVWIGRRVARGIVVRRIAPGQRAAPFAYWRRWLIPHVVLAATVLFCLTPAPVYVGFWISKPWMNAERAALAKDSSRSRSGPSLHKVRRWIGVYPVDRGIFVRRDLVSGPDICVMIVSEFGGFVYSPDGPPRGYSGYDLQDMSGGWYSFHRADVYR